MPFLVFAEVKINEIAWMGTSVSANDEWMELFNDSETEVDISGYRLEWSGGKYGVSISTEKCVNTKISSRGYFLLERTDDDSVPGGAYKADCIYTGALSNSGETLILKNSEGVEINRVDGANEWKINGGDEVVGSNTNKQTAQLYDGKWVTATSTPKSQNNSASPLTNNDIPNNNGTTTDESSETTTPSDSSFVTYSAHSSPVPVSEPVLKTRLSLVSGRNRVVLAGTNVVFSAKFIDASGKLISGGIFDWSFGDGGYSSEQQTTHSYENPGDYVVISNAFFEGEEYVGRSNIHVIEPNFDIEEENGSVKIKNNLTIEINLKDWKIVSGFKAFTFPSDTIILSGGELLTSKKIIGFEVGPGEEISLFSPTGKNILVHKVLLGENNKDKISLETNDVSEKVTKDDTESLIAELNKLQERLKELQKEALAGLVVSGEIEISDVVQPVVSAGSKKESVASPQIFSSTSTSTANNSIDKTPDIIVLGEGDNTPKNYSFWGFLKSFIYR